jgi:antitoxin HicB
LTKLALPRTSFELYLVREDRRREYRYTIFPKPEAGGYTVTVPTLPGIASEGDTLEEAIAMAKDAIRLYVEDLITDGETVPIEDSHPQAVVIDVAV